MRRKPSGARYSPSVVLGLVLAIILVVMLPMTVRATSEDSVFYMNHAGNFWRSNHPFVINDGELDVTQRYLANGIVDNRINVTNLLFSGYADLGDRYENGRTLTETLARFSGPAGLPITGTWPLTASLTPFSINFWFDVNSDGQTFNWESASGCPGSALGASCDRMTGLGGDSYALGPSAPMNPTDSYRAIQLDAATPFYMQGLCGGQTKTFQELIDGSCAGINGSTPVEIWAGIMAVSGDGGKQLAILNNPSLAATSGGGGGVPASTAPTGSVIVLPISTSPLAVSIYVLLVGVGVFGFGFLLKGSRWSGRLKVTGVILMVAGLIGILLFA